MTSRFGGINLTATELGRVLIVDDEILIRQGIKHYLNWENEGFTIVGEASNGQEALELIEATNPHIIVTDIVMPVMDGEQLTRIVKKRYPQIEVIVLSSFGDFDYVRSTFQSGVVDYILKPTLNSESLLKVLKNAVSRIPSLNLVNQQIENHVSIEQLLNKLISGYKVEGPEFEKLTTEFLHKRFCLLGTNLKMGRAELFKGVFEKLKIALQELNYSYHFEDHVLLVNGDNFTELIEYVPQLVESEPGIGFVLTEEFEDISQLGKIYKDELLILLSYRFYFSNYPLLRKDDLPNPLPKCKNFNLDGFTSDFKRKHFNSAFGYLQEHVKKMSTCYNTDVHEYKDFFGNIIFNITILLGNMEYNVKELEQSRYLYLKSIEESCSAQEAIEILEEFINEAKQAIFANQQQPENVHIKKILDYIHAHFAEPLTLSDVAQYFHFNPSYLSSYFSTHTHEGFNEYLNKVRIEEASKLLMQGTETISEISVNVGYSDHSYFCKVFKKIKGLSPSQFRRKQYMR